ncbi:hypothetical protein ZOSMA_594G00030 [Zostera marina]|uniref:Fungal lipase-type domain-containing protein n=1 Tax=Zostera marina TaxID=29655 RepID=A0A0K9NUT1_ZOSMR|nr:hypothetical protein ZOSMA_594G00030 [Zostera marina]
MACLVKAVYVRSKEQKLAQLWYESFNFEIHMDLMHISKVHGVIFKFDDSKAKTNNGHLSLEETPAYVIALRGTDDSHDIWHDLRMLFERLSCCNRVSTSTETVKDVLIDQKMENRHKIWLAGHSLGATIATYVSLSIAETNGIYLKLFLFNPPFTKYNEDINNLQIPYFKILRMPNFVITGIRNIAGVLFRPLMTKAEDDSNDFKNIQEWIPHLFVNPNDLICNGFIGYFENK